LNTNVLPDHLRGCPGRDELFAFSVGQLACEACEAIAGHVGKCPLCLSTLEALDDSVAVSIAEWRRPVPPEAFAEAAEQSAHRLAERLRDCPVGGADPADDPPTVRAAPEHLGDYQLLKQLGQGGMGVVYKARHTRLDSVVAVKVLPHDRWGDAQALARFRREMQALGRLKHPNIVQALDAREENGVHWLVMEYIEGIDLARLLGRSGPLPVADACEVIRQAALGLQYAHEQQGLVHRDIKPSNLMVTAAGGVKVLDLGLAQLHADSLVEVPLTVAGQVMGTLDYMAPEQVVDSHAVDIRTDIYSLGCTLFHLLAGAPPFAGPEYDSAGKKRRAHLEEPVPPIADRRPDVPPEVAAVLARMVAKRREDRFATPAEVAAALGPAAVGGDPGRWLTDNPCDPAVPATPPVRDRTPGPPGTPPSPIVTPHRQDASPERSCGGVATPAAPHGPAQAGGTRAGGSAAVDPVWGGIRSVLWGTRLKRRGWITAVLGLLAAAFLAPRFWPTTPPAPPPEPFKGWIDLRVWGRDNRGRYDPLRSGRRLNESNTLPLRANDEVKIEARLNRPAYLYVAVIDTTGKAAPVYPWKPGHWDRRPAEEYPVSHLSLPEGRYGWKVDKGPPGMATLLLLVRETPLPREVDLAGLLAGLPPQTGQSLRAAVWFENGEVVTNEVERAFSSFDPHVIDDPVLVTQVRLRDRLRPHFDYSRAVSFANEGKE
jgi:serine/threonine protein kinase